MALGGIESAQLCRERALFVARERHIAWRIPYLSLRYADLLLELEQYERARELVLDSLTYDCKAPCIRILLTPIGTRLAVVLRDDGLLRRCSDEHAIEYAFASGESARIGPLVSALVRMHVTRGELAAATTLLRRALPAVLSADHASDLLIDAAVLGNEEEQKRARSLLQARARLPSASLPLAYLDLFEAVRAKRDAGRQRESAQRAARRFKRIGWLAQERVALRYADEQHPESNNVSESPPLRAFRTMLGDLSTLTKREAEVAELALKGLTNRSIARELSISEHTVESHMASIMNRLGIRSRHQLTNMVTDSGRAQTP
ncbi:MAG: helix-turn-helix transcriptional regulator [Candidatus Tyrphobacter sp.]